MKHGRRQEASRCSDTPIRDADVSGSFHRQPVEGAKGSSSHPSPPFIHGQGALGPRSDLMPPQGWKPTPTNRVSGDQEATQIQGRLNTRGQQAGSPPGHWQWWWESTWPPRAWAGRMGFLTRGKGASSHLRAGLLGDQGASLPSVINGTGITPSHGGSEPRGWLQQLV